MNITGKNIRRQRTKKGLTQDQLAERLNVTRQAISNWETGKTQPDIETVTRLAEIFEISVEELIYGKSKAGDVYITSASKGGIGFGCALAMIISYTHWHSIGWAILHGLLNWIYVIYYIIRY